MLKGKRLAFLMVFFITQQSLACDNPNDLQTSRIYDCEIPPGLILPIHLLIDEDEQLPGAEPNVDYAIYKTGAIWPDWDWSEEEEEEKKEQLLASPPAPSIVPIAQPPPAPKPASPIARFVPFFSFKRIAQ